MREKGQTIVSLILVIADSSSQEQPKNTVIRSLVTPQLMGLRSAIFLHQYFFASGVLSDNCERVGWCSVEGRVMG